MRPPAAGSLAALGAAAAAAPAASRTLTCLPASLIAAPPSPVGSPSAAAPPPQLPAASVVTAFAGRPAMPYSPTSPSGALHGAPSGAAASPLTLPASSPGPLAFLPYEYGAEMRRRSAGGSYSGGWRAVAARWAAPAAQRRCTDGVWAAAAAPLAPLAVRHLHGTNRGVGEGDRDEDGGRTSALPYRAAPREEGLGAPMDVFDRSLKALHRDRAAGLLDSFDPLLAAVSARLLDRLEDCRRGFPTAVVLGGAALPVLHQLAGGRAGIERVVVVDTSQSMLDRVQREAAEARSRPGSAPWPRVLCVRGDEEHLPLQPGSVDLIISCLGLHWANDLPGAMAQCRMALRPDGLFLGALLGGDTLQELRIACALAQMEREGGVSAVVSPLAQVRDAGNLLTRADLRLPAVDVDRFRIGYPSPLELVQHLRALGESNAALRRRRSLSRDSALAAAAVYQSMFGSAEEGGSVSATFEVIFMTGWAPSANQPKAAKRGSATVSFQDLADGLVKGGAAVGGTAEDGVLTQPPEEAGAGTSSPPPPPL